MSSSFSWYNNSQSSDLTRHQRSPIHKHTMITLYKDTEKEKSILRNKLNILQLECIKNYRKAKSIQSSVRKVNQVKENYKHDKAQIQELLRRNQQKEEEKIEQIKLKKQQSKGNLPYIKYCLQRQKSHDYMTVKKRSKNIEEKIKIYKNSIIKDRQSNVQKIKEQQQLFVLNRTQFFEMKQSKVRKNEDKEALRIQRKMKRSRRQFQQMKTLEDSLLEKLDRSRQKLNKSVIKMSITLGA